MSAGYIYDLLIDCPEDGCIEEHGWLPFPAAATRELAAAVFVERLKTELGQELTPDQTATCSGPEYLWAYINDPETGESREPTRDEWDGEDVRFETCSSLHDAAMPYWRINIDPPMDV